MSKPSTLDETDLAILKLLRKNSRMGFAEMSKELGVSDATLQYRFKRLVKRRIIEAFTVVVSHDYAAYTSLGMALIKTEPDRHDQTKTELAALPEVTEVYGLFGEYDLMIKVYGRTLEEINDIFSDKIQTLPGIRELRKIAVVERVKEGLHDTLEA